jgi:hypothetical protein
LKVVHFLKMKCDPFSKVVRDLLGWVWLKHYFLKKRIYKNGFALSDVSSSFAHQEPFSSCICRIVQPSLACPNQSGLEAKVESGKVGHLWPFCLPFLPVSTYDWKVKSGTVRGKNGFESRLRWRWFLDPLTTRSLILSFLLSVRPRLRCSTSCLFLDLPPPPPEREVSDIERPCSRPHQHSRRQGEHREPSGRG